LYFFLDLANGEVMPVQKYLELDDATMYEIFKLCKDENDPVLSDLSDRLLNRRFFKVVPSEKVNKTNLLAELKQKDLDPKYYFAESRPKQLIIYKDGMIDGKDETIYFHDKYSLDPLSKLTIFEKSMVAINTKKTKKFYLFAD